MAATETLAQVHCPRCGRVLFMAAGTGMVVEIICRSTKCDGAVVRVEDVRVPVLKQ